MGRIRQTSCAPDECVDAPDECVDAPDEYVDAPDDETVHSAQACVLYEIRDTDPRPPTQPVASSKPDTTPTSWPRSHHHRRPPLSSAKTSATQPKPPSLNQNLRHSTKTSITQPKPPPSSHSLPCPSASIPPTASASLSYPIRRSQPTTANHLL
ncbi:hypothetical protein BJ138DRAFT_1119545 [Hygrophoropsis aurantiaca]|uniref:Uncharacterized protein n=1 Tax=Hygrophoropsis aurantiaca TaxID=72124 RepID=A0ACB7ZU80_9AGAM|nr:hypothetical protein BJ138DRAFT_1119545 [Hygrophoropsis aurantiaca]